MTAYIASFEVKFMKKKKKNKKNENGVEKGYGSGLSISHGGYFFINGIITKRVLNISFNHCGRIACMFNMVVFSTMILIISLLKSNLIPLYNPINNSKGQHT